MLLLEHETNSLLKAALEIAGNQGSLLVAHSVESALDFAKHYKPTHALIGEAQANQQGKFLPALLLEFSPYTEVVIVSDDLESKPRAAAAAAAG